MSGKAAIPGRGRRPKPTAQRVAGGNAGHRAINKNEPEFESVTDIDPPDWMPELAQNMWQHLMPQLLKAGVLLMTDLHNVEAFCMAYCRWREAEIDVTKNGVVVLGSQGGPIKNPALTAINETKKQMVQFGALLGLDPSSRTRLIGGKKTVDDNPFTRLIQ
jgi:P27 family predicted phage terminase small subunit